MGFLYFKCNITYYSKSTASPKDGLTNVDTRLHRFINILYEKQFHSKILLYTQNIKTFE